MTRQPDRRKGESSQERCGNINLHLLSQYLEHTLLAPGGEQLMKDAQDAVKRIENVALGIYPAKIKKF